MWPKALAQLIELLPHIARLLPAADRFLQNKTAGDESTRMALQQMADDLRGDLRRTSASHEGLYRQLNGQGERLAQLTEQVQAARAAAEAAEERAAGLERRISMNNALLAILLPLIVVLVILTILLLVRH
jgi:chromosome segregation ATPase